MNEAAQAAASQEDTTRPTNSELHEKGNTHQGPESAAVEESLEARLERLGRQRPDVFNSIWAEIGFVFSISMCQVLSVCTSIIQCRSNFWTFKGSNHFSVQFHFEPH